MKKNPEVMVFRKTADGLKPISIKDAGGIKHVMEQIKTAIPIPIAIDNNSKSNKDSKDSKSNKDSKGSNSKSNKDSKGSNSKSNKDSTYNNSKSNKDSTYNKGSKDIKKNIAIKLNRIQFIYTYLTDDTLIDFLLETNHDFTIYYNDGRRVDIEEIAMYYKPGDCDCIHCRKVVINEDPDILDKMTSKCYIELKLDAEILNIIAEKQFKILEIVSNIIVPLPSSIPSYPTFLPPLPILSQLPPLPPTLLPIMPPLATANLIDLTNTLY
uniref:Uncharacterized protein n=1 Tax=viral metagenome TaxID=1070528 RepID=A0A6C0I0I3_9ZZZZ